MPADTVITRDGPVAVPLDYQVPTGTEIFPRSLSVSFDGSGAAGAYVPVLEVIAPNGHVTAYCARQTEVAAGESVLVSFFPGVAEADSSSSSDSGSGGISSLASPTGTILVGLPTGPDSTVDLPVTGVAAGTYGDSLTVPQITVDAEGRATLLTDVAIASGAGGGIVQVSKVALTSGDLTTSSTSFVDATGLTTTITTGAHRCVVIFTAAGHAPGVNNNMAVDLAIDGTRQGQTYGLVITQAANANVHNENLSFVYVTDALSAGSHTFKIQWRVDAGTGTLFASAGVTPAILTVLELGV